LKVSTFNVTAVGASEDVAKMHADEIAKFVLGGKAGKAGNKPSQVAADGKCMPPWEADPRLPKPRHSSGDVSDDSGKDPCAR
jgi:hypothetical protein